MMKVGLERVAAGELPLKNKRVLLLSHAAAVTSAMQTGVAVLREQGATVARLFTPEHGYYAIAQDMEPAVVPSLFDVPTRSLYGETALDLVPPVSDFKDIDLLVVDVQDIGVRYYTYAWSAALCMSVAARCGVKTVVLDRPNPLGGEVLEGAPQRECFLSFVGLMPVSVRHGMTLGELMKLSAARMRIPDELLEVVAVEGWKRTQTFADFGRPWIMPSPNMPSIATARVYAGGCLLEGTTLSEGRGTTRPFELWGAPGMSRDGLNDLEHASLRPLQFRPMFQKYAGQRCLGVQVHAQSSEFRSYEAYAAWIHEVAPRSGAGEHFWRTETYEYDRLRPAIDLLTGGPEYRQIVNRNENLDAWREIQRDGEAKFRRDREPFLIYE